MIGTIVRNAILCTALVAPTPRLAAAGDGWPPYLQGGEAFRPTMKAAEAAFRDARPAPASRTLFPNATFSRVQGKGYRGKDEWDSKRLGEAVRLYGEAIAAVSPEQPADLRVCEAWEGKARALAQHGVLTGQPQEISDAHQLALKALNMRLGVQGDSHYDVGVSYQIVAEVQATLRTSRPGEATLGQAQENFKRALRVLEARPNLGQPGSGSTLFALANIKENESSRSYLYSHALDSLKGQLVTLPRSPSVLLEFIDVVDASYALPGQKLDIVEASRTWESTEARKLADDANKFAEYVKSTNSRMFNLYYFQSHISELDTYLNALISYPEILKKARFLELEKIAPRWREDYDQIWGALFEVAEASKSLPRHRIDRWDGLLYEAASKVAQERDDATGLFNAGRVIHSLGSRLIEENRNNNAPFDETIRRLDESFKLFANSLARAVPPLPATTPTATAIPPLLPATAIPPLSATPPPPSPFLVPVVPSGSPGVEIVRAEREMYGVLDDFLRLADLWDRRSLFVNQDDQRDLYEVAHAMVRTAPASNWFLFDARIEHQRANHARDLLDRPAAEIHYHEAVKILDSPPGGRKYSREVLVMKRDMMKDYVAFLQDHAKFYPENTLKSEKESLDSLEKLLKPRQ